MLFYISNQYNYDIDEPMFKFSYVSALLSIIFLISKHDVQKLNDIN